MRNIDKNKRLNSRIDIHSYLLLWTRRKWLFINFVPCKTPLANYYYFDGVNLVEINGKKYFCTISKEYELCIRNYFLERFFFKLRPNSLWEKITQKMRNHVEELMYLFVEWTTSLGGANFWATFAQICSILPKFLGKFHDSALFWDKNKEKLWTLPPIHDLKLVIQRKD